jgi:hypothetical protein
MLIEGRTQGLDKQGWASDRLKWMLPEGTGDVIVRGRVPADSKLTGQMLAVSSKGCELGRWPVGPGTFELRFPAAFNQGPFLFEDPRHALQTGRLELEG